MKKTASLFIAGVCLFHFSACATIVSGSKSPLLIRSQPSGAEVSIDGVPAGTTPLFTDIRRREDHEIRLSKAGFVEASHNTGKRFNEWAAGNVVFGLFGIFGLLVDAATGAVFSPSSDELHIKLTPKEEAALMTPAEESSAAQETLPAETAASSREGAAKTKGDPELRTASKVSQWWGKGKNALAGFFKSAVSRTKSAVSRLRYGGNPIPEEELRAARAMSESAAAEKEPAKVSEPAINPEADKNKTKLRKKSHPIFNLGSGGIAGFIVNAMKGFAGPEKDAPRNVPVPESPAKPPAPVEAGFPIETPVSEAVRLEVSGGLLPLAQSPATKAALTEPAYEPAETPAAVRVVELREHKETRELEIPAVGTELVMPERGEVKSFPVLTPIEPGAEKPLILKETPLAKADLGMLKGGPIRPAQMVNDLVEDEPVPAEKTDFRMPRQETAAPAIRAAEGPAEIPEGRMLARETVLSSSLVLLINEGAEEMLPVPGGSTSGIGNRARDEEKRKPAAETLSLPAAESFLRQEGGRVDRSGSGAAKSEAPAYTLVKII